LSSEPIETNDLLCVIVSRKGEVLSIPNGKITKSDKLPVRGDLYSVGEIDCQVAGHAYTPHLLHTWHLFLTEIDVE
jgi:hypothetical protein